MSSQQDAPKGRPLSKGVRALSEIDALATIECVEAVKRLGNWNDAQFLRAFAGAQMTLNPEDYKEFDRSEVRFNPEASTLSRLSRLKYSKSSPYIKGLYLWFSKDYGNILKIKQSEEKLYGDEQQVLRLGDLLGTSFGKLAPHFIEAATKFVGTYKLYRPFHADPLKRIQVSKLIVGSDSSIFTCRLESSHFDERLGENRINSAVGKFVSTSDKAATAILYANESSGLEPDYERNSGYGGNYIINIHSPEWRSDEKGHHISFFSGIVLATIGNKAPSAWPLFAMAHRSDKDFEPHVLEADEIQKLPPLALAELSRGGVYWNEQDSPHTFDKSAVSPSTP